jgi:hypothetical protein
MGFGSKLSILTNNTILLGRQYFILYGPNHHLKKSPMCSFGNKKIVSPRRKFLFCDFVKPIMLCSITLYLSYLQLPGRFHPKVPIMPYNWSKYEQERSFDRDVHCLLVTSIMLASKDKGHKPSEIKCV